MCYEPLTKLHLNGEQGTFKTQNGKMALKLCGIGLGLPKQLLLRTNHLQVSDI